MDKRFTVHVVPHTHWDREWYFTLEEFRYRLVKLMDRLLDAMERGAIEYFQMDGQTIMLEDYLAVRPQNRERFHKLVKDGRLLIGPWYTQPNVFMSGAEAQVRNLLLGKKDMERWDAPANKVNYMPDMFGFPGQLPQMMEGFGLDHLIGARGMPKQCHTYLRWEGVDGTMVHVCALPGSYINACGISEREEQQIFSVFGEKIVLPSLPDRMQGVLWEKNRAIAPQILALNGVDHMYPNPHMLETIEKMREMYPDVDVEQSNFAKYIEAVQNTLTQEPVTITGEQRDGRELWVLTASQSTRMNIKKYNRKMEDMLERRVEPLMSLMKSLGETDLPEAELAMAWELILQNHAHDSLCCANSDPSYHEIYTRYEKADDIAREICNELEQRLIRRLTGYTQEAILVRNPTPVDRAETITLDILVSNHRDFAEPHVFCDGVEVPAHVISVKPDMVLRYVPFSGLVGQLSVAAFRLTIDPGTIPAMGWKLLEIKGGRQHDRAVSGLVTGQNTIENEHLKVEVCPDATLTVTDKATGKVYTGLNRFMDSGETGCGFIHAAPYNDHYAVSTGKNLDIAITQNNPLCGEITVSQDFVVPKGLAPDCLSRSAEKTDIHLVTKVILRPGQTYVELQTDVENTAKDHRLRVAFPSDTNTDEGFAGQPYDVISRPVQPEGVNHYGEGDWEPLVGFHPMHDICGIADGDRGVTIAGDGLMEYEILPMRNTVTLTLIRATDRLHVGVLGAGSKFKIHEAQLLGKQSFRYAFFPSAEGFASVMPAVERFRHPLVPVQKDFLEAECMPDYVPAPVDVPACTGFIRVDGKVVTTSLKPAENGDGMILRFYNPVAEATDVTVTLDPVWKLQAVSQVRLDETQDAPIAVSGNGFRVHVGGKKILSFRINANKV